MAWLLFLVIMVVTAVLFVGAAPLGVLRRGGALMAGSAQRELSRGTYAPVWRPPPRSSQARVACGGHGVRPSLRWRSLGMHALLIGRLRSIFVFPVLWMVITSFKSDGGGLQRAAHGAAAHLAVVQLPRRRQYIDYGRYTFNTALISGLVVLGTVLSCSVSAYAFACIRWPGRGLLFALALSTMLLPYPVTIVPLFVTFRNLGWTGRTIGTSSCRWWSPPSSAMPSSSSCCASSS